MDPAKRLAAYIPLSTNFDSGTRAELFAAIPYEVFPPARERQSPLGSCQEQARAAAVRG